MMAQLIPFKEALECMVGEYEVDGKCCPTCQAGKSESFFVWDKSLSSSGKCLPVPGSLPFFMNPFEFQNHRISELKGIREGNSELRGNIGVISELRGTVEGISELRGTMEGILELRRTMEGISELRGTTEGIPKITGMMEGNKT